MKIALVILHADAARGGSERYTLDLADGLVKRGHDVSILASSFQTQPFSGKPVMVQTGAALTRTGRYLNFVHNVMCQLMPAGQFDVVHAMLPVIGCDVYHPHAGIAADVVHHGHRTKSSAMQRALAWIGNRTNFRRLRFAAVERKILTSPKLNPPTVLCLSNLIRDVVRREYPSFPQKKLASLFNGVDLSRFDPQLRPDARAAIREKFAILPNVVVGLVLAQDFERKGLRQAIQALAEQTDRQMVLLVGGKPDPSKFQQLARSLGIGDRVIFAGPVSDSVEFYKAADFFVLPTRFDPCSLVVLEALAMGLPVISTSSNGACEVMEDGRHGYVLNGADNIAALCAAMHGMQHSAERARMSQECLKLRGKLSQEVHLAALETVYLSLRG